MKHSLLLLSLTLIFISASAAPVRKSGKGVPDGAVTISNENIRVTVGKDGHLYALTNLNTGHNYATGDYMWRIYYDATYEKEIQILGAQEAQVSQNGNEINVVYSKLSAEGKDLDMQLALKITLEQDKVRFGCQVSNNEPHTVIRELQYPLVRNIRIPADHKLYTAEGGGKLYDDPVKTVSKIRSTPYMVPEQHFRQRTVKYGSKVFMNCFGLFGEAQGLYFGSHDPTFQDTWHGMRAYPGENGVFDNLEFGFYKYPHCFNGESWSCDANVIAPYSGTWHVASKLYRSWVNTWWDYREPPQWVKEMKSWQRVIFKHQYGDYLFKYSDLNGRLKDVDKSINSNAVFMFGWWNEGMDNGNPDYSPDESQGGDAGLKKAIAEYQKDGSKLLLYYNGKLIDKESRFYKSGMGPKVCRHDKTGSEMIERYKFAGYGTWLKEYDQRSFAVATMMHPDWNEVLFALQDRAYELGASSVFFDQLGFIESESTNWDTSREFPVPDTYGIQKRAQCLKMLRDRYIEKDPEFALGVEGTMDALAQYCAYSHGYPENEGPERWMNFFKYTFPEFIFSDRGQRDERNVQCHVNNTILDGQRVDIEIFRCRDLIDQCPKYQAYLAAANEIKGKYSETLLCGRYNDIFGFSNSNPEAVAKAYVSEGKMAIVVANQHKDGRVIKTSIKVPGYRFVEYSALGTPEIAKEGKSIKLGQYDLAVLLFERE